ncbi:DUF5808 domain-containing protein [Sinomonas notoginsengisoli]|uniref:DUF1648 domain-containing protein n=1 Tax=Sinomonas notoginsengisoli TaxID=1457311 RepID=UPI001F2A0EAE|nr:DUF5808 domain-containing protein [Sinomonas notoginsengisoli]
MTIAVVLSSALSALVLAVALLLPSINSRTVPFGVRVPEQHADDPTVLRQTRIYRSRVVASWTLAAAVGVVVYGLTGETFLPSLSVLLLVGLWYGCFFLANREIRAAKAAGGWYKGLHQAIAVDTGLRTDPPRFPWLWLAPALILTVATVAIGVLSYPSMPEVLAVHYAKGMPNRIAAKSVGTAFSLVFVQVGITALLAGMAAAIIFRSRPDIDPAHPAGSARWHRHYMVLGAKALLGLAAVIDLGMLGSSLLMWTGTVTQWASAVIGLPILAAVAVAAVVLARNNREPDEGEEDTGLSHRDDDRYWRGGLIYINREDRALLVPRRFSLGWTLNFGNPTAAMLLVGLVALIGLAIALRFEG